jgi:ADP-ribose pyrophosphatase YjhB (NUDIX family)
MDMSWMQQHALLVLLRSKTARVKELIPDSVPANQFSYHLEGLVVAGLVEKKSRGIYQLTPGGETFVGSFSTDTNSPVKDIKTVIMFYGKKDGKYLLFKWSRQPYLESVTLPYDRLAYGQSIEDGVNKAVHDKLGATVQAQYISSIIVKIFHDTNLISHMNAAVYAVNTDELGLPFTSRNGELFLGHIPNAFSMGGLEKLIEAIEGGDTLPEIILNY